jgi:hypothetical protein
MELPQYDTAWYLHSTAGFELNIFWMTKKCSTQLIVLSLTTRTDILATKMTIFVWNACDNDLKMCYAQVRLFETLHTPHGWALEVYYIRSNEQSTTNDNLNTSFPDWILSKEKREKLIATWPLSRQGLPLYKVHYTAPQTPITQTPRLWDH